MSLPTGPVTFLFTDIEGSTKLWEAYPEAMHIALAQHDKLMRNAIERHNGRVFKTVGDAFCAVFTHAPDALGAGLNASLALSEYQWGETGPLRVRIAIHTGQALHRDNDYFGPTLNRTARLQSITHGQQILLSQAAYDLVMSCLPAGAGLIDLGMHRLKDLAAPERVWQLQHEALPQAFPPLRSLDYLPTNLTQQLTSFVGREKEMAEIKGLLAAARLVTLSGSGGSGKTRLALQAAADVLEQYSDGVYLVELAPIADPSLVPQTVADVMAVRESMAKDITGSLLDSLKDKHLLLVLDNCEHLLDSAAQLADDLLRFCPKLTVMASSREALGISGERIYRVPSLTLPVLNTDYSPDALSGYESVRLFVERAVAVKSDFTITPENAPSLVSVCRRLDGIPLAIELAAARVRALPVEQIEARLDSRFRLLTGGSRTALPRQQTLRALIDWSYDLLNDNEKLLLHRLSVFAAGWSIEAAEKVCAGADILSVEMLDMLISLVDKSLVVFEDAGGTSRYRLLETVRQYARDRLVESGEGETVRDRHLAFYLTLAENAEPMLTSPAQGEWLLRLEAEHENLRASLEWSLNCSSAIVPSELAVSRPPLDIQNAALRLCASLWRFWWTRGHLSEGREWFKRTLELKAEQYQLPERAKALNGAANLAWMQNDYVTALVMHGESLTIHRANDDRRGIAITLGNLGLVAYSQSNYAKARDYCEESLSIKRELGDQNLIAGSLNYLGAVADSQGDYASAQRYYEESLTIHTAIGDRIGIASTFSNLGTVAFLMGDYRSSRSYHEQGLAIVKEIGHRQFHATALTGLGTLSLIEEDFPSARSCLDESLSIFREIGDRRGEANALASLGNLALAEHHTDSAVDLLKEGLDLFRSISDRKGTANTLISLGNAACLQGDFAGCRSYFNESLTIYHDIGDMSGIAIALEGIARAAAKQQNPDRAARLLGAAEAVREAIGSTVTANQRAEHDSLIAELTQSLGDDEFRLAWFDGRSMSGSDAVALALT